VYEASSGGCAMLLRQKALWMERVRSVANSGHIPQLKERSSGIGRAVGSDEKRSES
jgi:hypothetical protein